MKFLITIIMLIIAASTAQGFELTSAKFELGRLYNKRDLIEPKYTLLQQRSPDGEKEVWDYQIGLLLNTTIIENSVGKFYWNQKVEAQSTTVQYRRVHWDFEFGINVLDKVDMFWHHRSEHLLDASLDDYPLHDVYGVRVCLLKKCN